MSIAEWIIESGPFAEGQVLPPELVREIFKTARLNELRDELIAGRRGVSPEDMQRFQVMGDMNADHSWLNIVCGRCPWSADVEDPASLAELVRRAEEHGEVCR